MYEHFYNKKKEVYSNIKLLIFKMSVQTQESSKMSTGTNSPYYPR